MSVPATPIHLLEWLKAAERGLSWFESTSLESGNLIWEGMKDSILNL
jgi:hypothetical protein